MVTTVPALLAARGLGLKTDFSELLPDNKPSVVEMRRVGEKLTSASTLTLVAEVPQGHPEALERFAQAVVPRIQALGPEWVGAVDAGNREAHTFLDHNKLLYAPLDEIRKVHDEVRERYDYEVQKRAGGDLDLAIRRLLSPPRRSASGSARPTRSSRRERAAAATTSVKRDAPWSSWSAPRSSREASSPRTSSSKDRRGRARGQPDVVRSRA